MALSNLFPWEEKEKKDSGNGNGKPEEVPTACGSACGAEDK